MPTDEEILAAREYLKVYEFFEIQKPVLEKNNVGRLHLFREALQAGRVHNAPGWNKADWTSVQPFVVEHNWAAAFANATDYDGEFRLPFESCVFEFRISGHNVFMFANERPGQEIVFVGFAGRGDWWVLPGDLEQNSPGLLFAQAQVKAICIALEAEVAVGVGVDAPAKLNKKRLERGRQPLLPYHVVRLRPRQHWARSGEGAGTRKRLHFRRGHWRHYEDHTTWIKWMLVGDPDLGFVEKEYRL